MPMNPSGADLHIDGPLTNVSVAHFLDRNDFIADKVFPTVPVDKRSDIFWKYSKSDWRRSSSQKRAPGTESAGVGWSNTTDNYNCDVYAVHVDIDKQTRANADSNWNLDSDATRRVTDDLLLGKDIHWAATYFKTGVWGIEYTGKSASPSTNEFLQFDQSASDPLSFVTTVKTEFRLSVGKPVTFMVLGPDVWDTLQNHPAILDRIKYTQKGVITRELVAEFFGVQNLYVAYASKSTGPTKNDAAAQDTAAAYSWVADTKSILMGYAPARASLLEPSAGYTFNWRGYTGNRAGLAITNFYDPKIKADRIEGEAAYDMKLVSADCGVFLKDAVA